MDWMRIDVAGLARGDACEVAKSRWRFAHLIKILFMSLLFLLCLALVAAVIGFIWLFFFAEDRNPEAIATGIAGIVDGAIVTFLVTQVKYVNQAEKDAFRAVKEACPDTA